MMRYWIGIALLAGSWLFGLGYFYPPNAWAWLAAVATGVVLLSYKKPDISPENHLVQEPSASADGCGDVSTNRWPSVVAILLLLPAIGYAAWPYKAAPLLIAAGLGLPLLPLGKRWSECLASGALTAGVVMLVQALGLELYAAQTAYSHDLPRPLPGLLAGLATLLGMDAAADGSSIVMHSMRQTHRMGATWELLLDPATFLFYFGGLALLTLHASNDKRRKKVDEVPTETGETGVSVLPDSQEPLPQKPVVSPWSTWIRDCRIFTLVVFAWLPVRAGLMMSLYLHRVLRSDPDRPLHAMNHFFSPWMLLALLAVPALLAWLLVRAKNENVAGDQLPQVKEEGKEKKGEERKAHSLQIGKSQTSNQQAPNPQPLVDAPSSKPQPPVPCPCALPLAAAMIGLAIAFFTATIYWNPVGARRDGRVMVVERHSNWEPTGTPYDTKSFGEPSGYNYAAIYNYLGQYYQMSRLLEKDKIDEQTLAGCDVLVIKTPTTRYSPEEVKAVAQFVERGGGLLLVGDHTNFERSGTIMNDITRRMGFTFRDDLLFGFGASPYDEHFVPPPVAHPIVQNVGPMDFAVSCSIDPGTSCGRSAVLSTGLWSMGPEYHNENYHPIPQHCPEMRYGAFIQVWAAQFGNGRAVAFTDSTIFSNFCVFQPGKAEMMLGMVEWLNHDNPSSFWYFGFLLLAVASTVGGLWMARGYRDRWLLLMAAGTCGWVVASLAVAATHRLAMPVPERVRPELCAVIDRTTSDVPLSKGADTKGNGEGYGLFEQWIARTGRYTVRKSGPDVFSRDALVVICPSRSVTEEFRKSLVQYVEDGGRLLVVDSPENAGSTANSLLLPFGLSVRHDHTWKGKLTTTDRLPVVDIEKANEIVGGRPIGKLDKMTVAAVAKHGKGSVMAIGFGSLWNDKRMGEHWMLEPNPTVKARYDVLFALLGLALDDKPLPSSPPVKKKPTEELPLKESGPAEIK